MHKFPALPITFTFCCFNSYHKTISSNQSSTNLFTDNMTAESFFKPKDVLNSVERQYIGNISGPEKIYLLKIYRQSSEQDFPFQKHQVQGNSQTYVSRALIQSVSYDSENLCYPLYSVVFASIAVSVKKAAVYSIALASIMVPSPFG